MKSSLCKNKTPIPKDKVKKVLPIVKPVTYFLHLTGKYKKRREKRKWELLQSNYGEKSEKGICTHPEKQYCHTLQ